MNKRDAIYKLCVDTAQAAKEALGLMSEKEIEGMIAANLQILDAPKDIDELEIPISALKQIALLANVALTRLLYERYKK